VNVVRLGFICTLGGEGVTVEVVPFLASRHALRRLDVSFALVERAAWLASDGASSATGTYPVDGGELVR
jgi:hypothetical protein